MARAGRTLARVGSCTELLATPEKAFPAVNAGRANDNAAASAGLIQKNRELKQRRRATIFRLGVFVRFGCIRTRRGSIRQSSPRIRAAAGPRSNFVVHN